MTVLSDPWRSFPPQLWLPSLIIYAWHTAVFTPPPLSSYFMFTHPSFSLHCLFQPPGIVPCAHGEAKGCGSFPLHNLVSDPLPQSFVG